MTFSLRSQIVWTLRWVVAGPFLLVGYVGLSVGVAGFWIAGHITNSPVWDWDGLWKKDQS